MQIRIMKWSCWLWRENKTMNATDRNVEISIESMKMDVFRIICSKLRLTSIRRWCAVLFATDHAVSCRLRVCVYVFIHSTLERTQSNITLCIHMIVDVLHVRHVYIAQYCIRFQLTCDDDDGHDDDVSAWVRKRNATASISRTHNQTNSRIVLAFSGPSHP